MVGKYNTALILLENGADFKKPLFFRPEENRDIFLVDLLREDLVDLETEEYRDKMKIAVYLKGKGVDYRATPIPEFVRKKAQENHPDNWKKYLEKY